jgi:hypothetical protein
MALIHPANIVDIKNAKKWAENAFLFAKLRQFKLLLKVCERA